MIGNMFNLKHLIFVFCFSFLIISCDAVNSQENLKSNQNLNANTKAENPETSTGDYESGKAGAEELNKQPLPATNPQIINKPFPREKIRQTLIANKLIGESANGEIGGYK